MSQIKDCIYCGQAPAVTTEGECGVCDNAPNNKLTEPSSKEEMYVPNKWVCVVAISIVVIGVAGMLLSLQFGK